METKSFLKWVTVVAVFLIGTIYLASSLLISDRIASLVDFRSKNLPSFRIVGDNRETSCVYTCDHTNFVHHCTDTNFVLHCTGTNFVHHCTGTICALHRTDTNKVFSLADKPNVFNSPEARGATTGRLLFRIESERPSAMFLFSLIPAIVKIIVFAALLLTPLVILYMFLIRPIRDIPIVEPTTIRNLDSADRWTREESGTIIARAMWEARLCSDEDRETLKSVLARPSEIDKRVKELLGKREKAAKGKALEVAAMAGLTVAVSSSSIGDGLGMFFWKSKLVYETFRIYGFRPKASTILSIWAHVVFASFFAASLEELCDLFDVSEFVGGVAVRLVQGIAGAAVVLKGGELTRTYVIGGVSPNSRRRALENFRKYAKDDIAEISATVTRSMCKIGLKGFCS